MTDSPGCEPALSRTKRACQRFCRGRGRRDVRRAALFAKPSCRQRTEWSEHVRRSLRGSRPRRERRYRARAARLGGRRRSAHRQCAAAAAPRPHLLSPVLDQSCARRIRRPAQGVSGHGRTGQRAARCRTIDRRLVGITPSLRSRPVMSRMSRWSCVVVAMASLLIPAAARELSDASLPESGAIASRLRRSLPRSRSSPVLPAAATAFSRMPCAKPLAWRARTRPAAGSAGASRFSANAPRFACRSSRSPRPAQHAIAPSWR